MSRPPRPPHALPPASAADAFAERLAEVVRDAGGPWSSGAADRLGSVLDSLREALAECLDALRAAPGDVAALDRLRRLHRLAAELLDAGALARVRAAERATAAAERLAEVGPISELVDRTPAEAAGAADLHRVVLSRVADGWLAVEGLHWADDAADASSLLAELRAAPARLEYPLAEAEMLRRRRPELVTGAAEAPPGRHAFSDAMRSDEYVAAPIVLEGRVIGFLHGDRAAGRPLQSLDRDALWTFAGAFAGLFERAVLRRRLRVQRQELRQVASWADARISDLSDGVIDLPADRHALDPDEPVRPAPRRAELDALLTRREIDVLELMAKGESNAEIARALVVSQGTVKFHVKNILRKLNASNRAEAAARYLRASLGTRDGEARPARGSWHG